MPGRDRVAAWLDLARTVVRRAERLALAAAPPPSLAVALPQPALRPAVDHGPLAGGPVPHDPVGRRPRPGRTPPTAHRRSPSPTPPRSRSPSPTRSTHDPRHRVAASTPRDVDVVGVPVFSQRSGAPVRSACPGRRLGELGFEGKPGQTLTVPSASGPSTVAVGLGEPAKLTTGRAAHGRGRARPRRGHADGAGDRAGRRRRRRPARAAVAQAVAEGFALGTYRFSAFKSEPAKPRLERVVAHRAGRAPRRRRRRQRPRARPSARRSASPATSPTRRRPT